MLVSLDQSIRGDHGGMLNRDSGTPLAPLGVQVLALQRPRRAESPVERPTVRFAFQPLSVPHVVRTASDGEGVLFVRFSAPVAGSDVIAVPPLLEKEVALALAEHRRNGDRVDRVVLVGADALFAGASAATGDPAEAEGYGPAVEALASLFDALVREGVPFTWRTRGGLSGTMPAALSRALLDARALATVEVGLPSLDAALCRELEGTLAATPEERLRLATAVSARGVPVRGLVEPLVPMLNDQVAVLEPLLQALVDAGAHRVGVRYLVLTHGRAKALTRRLSRMHRALVQGIFADQPWREGDERQAGSTNGPHKLLPATLRHRGHQRVMDLGARLGLVVDVLDPVGDEPPSAPSEEPKAGDGAAKPRGRRRGRRERPQLDLFASRVRKT